MTHRITNKTKQLVALHATVGTPQDLIASILKIDPKTLRAYYRDELDLSKAKSNAAIGGALYNKAIKGNVPALIFWAKTQMGFREKESGQAADGKTNIMPVPVCDSVDDWEKHAQEQQGEMLGG